MRDFRRGRWLGRALRAGPWVALVTAACALAIAGVPHTFNTGDPLEAADLNANFAALEQRIAALEAKDPFSGTYPAVFGLGTGYDHLPGDPPPNPAVPDRGGTWFCGPAPQSLQLDAPDAGEVTFSHGFGSVIFTSGGRVALNLDFPWIEHGSTSICGPDNAVCAAPLTFFLRSPRSQMLTIHNVLDNAGAIYVNGVRVGPYPLGGFPNETSVQVPEGAFSLSFMGCSEGIDTTTANITIAFDLYDAFLTNPAYGLTVDYDRTFHRNGR